MCEWEYTYLECNGLEFIIDCINDELTFDVDYNGDFLILDIGDELEVDL